MSNEVNQPWDAPDYDPWNQGTYRTGSTRPPKSHGGLLALLLVLVILLSGCSGRSIPRSPGKPCPFPSPMTVLPN